MSFKYGWDDFCTNNLNADDTCFFSVIRVATYSNDDDEEEELKDDEAKLKMEVRKMADGGGELGARVDTICILLFHQYYYLACQDF